MSTSLRRPTSKLILVLLRWSDMVVAVVAAATVDGEVAAVDEVGSADVKSARVAYRADSTSQPTMPTTCPWVTVDGKERLAYAMHV